MKKSAEENIKLYIGKMVHLQESILDFINTDDPAESNYQEIISFIENRKIRENRSEVQAILHLLLKVSNNHHRNPNFFSKIERIISIFQKEIHVFYSNYEIFNFFKSNKRLLLFLFKDGIIKPDKQIACTITGYKYQQAFYPHFLFPEFKTFYDEIMLQKINDTMQTLEQTQVDNSKSFDQKRQNGENDHILCELIRNDSIDQFTSFITQNKLELTTTIESSIYETNSFLINQKPTLIEYAAFFGSLNIFRFLCSKEIELTPSLWTYAVHGKNNEIIKILYEKKISFKDDSFKDVFVESIKCHHNEFASFIQSKMSKQIINDVSTQIIKYYNYSFFPTDIKCNDIRSLCDFCKYNYFNIVNLFLTSDKVPINSQSILSFYFK